MKFRTSKKILYPIKLGRSVYLINSHQTRPSICHYFERFQSIHQFTRSLSTRRLNSQTSSNALEPSLLRAIARISSAEIRTIKDERISTPETRSLISRESKEHRSAVRGKEFRDAKLREDIFRRFEIETSEVIRGAEFRPTTVYSAIDRSTCAR